MKPEGNEPGKSFYIMGTVVLLMIFILWWVEGKIPARGGAYYTRIDDPISYWVGMFMVGTGVIIGLVKIFKKKN